MSNFVLLLLFQNFLFWRVITVAVLCIVSAVPKPIPSTLNLQVVKDITMHFAECFFSSYRVDPTLFVPRLAMLYCIHLFVLVELSLTSRDSPCSVLVKNSSNALLNLVGLIVFPCFLRVFIYVCLYNLCIAFILACDFFF